MNSVPAESVAKNGHAGISQVLPKSLIQGLQAELSDCGHGTRNLLEKSAFRELAALSTIKQLAVDILGSSAFAVRAIFFDKTRNSNWKVMWHQDTAIAVVRQKHSPRFGPWSIKEGVPHVLAPADVLERMLAIRLHLDDCGAQHGPLRVVPASHKSGIYDEADIQNVVVGRTVSCFVSAGDAILMRPLLLHASSACIQPEHRRVIHIEYAALELPDGLDWFWRIA